MRFYTKHIDCLYAFLISHIMKRKIIYTIITFLILTTSINAQHAIGSWQNYLSYHNVIRTAPAGNLIYAVGNGDLFSYDKEDESIQCYWKNNLLTDTDISYIAYQREYKTLIVVYSNANIDLIVNDKEVYNLPDYMNKNMTQNKTVNHISFAKEYAYLSTDFGIVVLNLKKKEINNAYILNKKINACAVDDNKIYAASTNGLLTGLLTDNLLDINNWKNVSNTIYSFISMFNDELIGNITSSGVYIINRQNYSYSQLTGGNFNYMQVCNDKLLAGNENSLAIIDNINKIHYLNHGLKAPYIFYENGIYWAAGKENGLMGLTYNETKNTLEVKVSSILPDSPKRNLPNYMKFEGERLFITGGGNTNNNHPGTIMMFENNTWSNFQEEGISEKTGVSYSNISSIAQDPTDDRHHFASSVTQGLYEFYDYEFINHYTYDNSPLEVATPITNPDYYKNFVRINGLTYDNDNNLWMLNCEAEHPIHVLKPDKKWVNLHYPEVTNITSFEHIFFDQRGWLWATATGIIDKTGIFCLNTNGTLEDNTDDHHKLMKSFINQDGTKLDYITYCMAIDKEGAIWVGTNHGPLLFSNPSKFFDENFYCTQIKVPRNDGTNLADFLLSNDIIKTIAIDGANRKWIGTNSNGVYLISPDGLETIHHFTVDNSPLLSNSISYITIHPRTGEVFIGTSLGLVSYQSDATEAGENFSDNVYAYPNPVKPDYTGVITVTGLVRDSDVKITNVNGKLIYSGTSVGGQFTWNGLNSQGDRVPSGIYFVLAADQDGKQSVATKILIVK